MEPVFFVMAILGCGDSQADCREARVDTAHYSTAAQCQAAMPTALARHTDLSFPVIAASCRANGPIMARADKPARRG
jgi:hypothetical protein